MNVLWVLIKKEILDNTRDRRSLVSSLIYGPILIPLFLILSLSLGIDQQSIETDKPLRVYTAKLDALLPLADFLSEQNISLEQSVGAYSEKLHSGEYSLFLEPDTAFDQHFRLGDTPVIRIVFNSESSQSASDYRRLRLALSRYQQHLAGLRMQLRGIDAASLTPFAVMDVDIGRYTQPQQFFGRIVALVVVMAMILGGFYLAIDTSAGERERRSMEPLLVLPINKLLLVGGKIIAVASFVLLSGSLALGVSLFSSVVLPAEFSMPNSGLHVLGVLSLLFQLVPLAVFLSCFMVFLSSFSATVKEAQTHLALLVLLPMSGFFTSQFLNVNDDSLLWNIPLIGQFWSISRALTSTAGSAPPSSVLMLVTVLISMLLFIFVSRRFSSEAMLEN